MGKYVDFVYMKRRLLTFITIVITLLAIAGVRQLEINAKFDIFKIDHSKYQDQLDEMNKIFDSSNQVLLLVESKESLSNLTTDLEADLDQVGVTYVSPLELTQFLDNIPESADTSLINPIKEDGNTTYLTYYLNLDQDFDFDRLVQVLDQGGFDYYLSGDTYMQYEIIQLIFNVLIFIPPLALFLILLVFRSQLGSVKAALLSVIPAGMAALWTMGFIGWLGQEVSIITVLAPVFSIVIGSADGLHFVTHMEESLQDQDHKTALKNTLAIVGLPMIITTTTSMAGFLGLLFIDTSSIQLLAIFASLGVFLAGIITWLVLPLVFTSHIHLRYKKHSKKGFSLVKLWGKPSIILVATLLVLSSFFLTSIKTEFNQLMFFRDFTRVQQSFDKILDINDGAIPLFYYGSTPIHELPSQVDKVNGLLTQLESSDHVSKVNNPLKFMNLGQVDPSMLKSLDHIVKIENGRVYYKLMIFPKDLTNATITSIEDQVLAYDADLDGAVIGSQMMMREMNETMVRGQILSILFTFAAILSMLWFTLKSFKLALISSVPIGVTSFILYGFLGLTGISLNLMTCTIFSITLGIGVDYAIHYTSTYKYYLDKNHENARLMAYKFSSRPVIANAIGLSLGLSALWLSPLQIHLHISTLVWVSMTVAVISSLTLLPTLLAKK